MNFIRFFCSETNISWRPILIMAILSGVANGLLLGVINTSSASAMNDSVSTRHFLLYMVCMGVFFLSKKYALTRAAVIVEEVLQAVRVRIAGKIRSSELLFIEKLGKPEIYTRLSQDMNLISQSGIVIINACQEAIMLVFCLVYIAYLSTIAFGITIGAISLGVIIYFNHRKGVLKDLHAATGKEAALLDSLNHVLDGFKEIKVNRKKSDSLYATFKGIAAETEELKARTSVRFVTDIMFSQVFFYILIASVIFLLPRFSFVMGDQIMKLTASILFIVGPLDMLVSSVPIITRSNVSVDNLYKLEDMVDNSFKDMGEPDCFLIEQFRDFKEIKLTNCVFSYLDGENRPLFTVGPINMDIRRGEVLFLVGGNGSGKSTIVKLLTGLYYPVTGTIEVDGMVLNQQMYTSFRELFSIIFGDFHLFDRLYGLEDVDEKKVFELLKLMELEHKTRLTEGHFSTTDLSTGQRKRLALIVSLLEEKDIFVFDEWAADQDPIFRKYFYDEILRDLKKQGKTVIAVSHDDRYFHLADRVVTMEYGRIDTIETHDHPVNGKPS